MSAKDRLAPDMSTMTIEWPERTTPGVVDMFYSPSQPRGADGRWTKGGGSGGRWVKSGKRSGRSPKALRKAIENAADPNSPAVDPIRTELYRALSAEGATDPASIDTVSSDLSVPDGGFTYNPANGTTARAGFAVSPYPELSREVDLNGKSDVEVRREVTTYMRDNAKALAEDSAWLGGWHDPDTGKAWLDVSILVDTAERAREIGLKRDQLAYFDMGTMNSVVIDSNATSGQG